VSCTSLGTLPRGLGFRLLAAPFGLYGRKDSISIATKVLLPSDPSISNKGTQRTASAGTCACDPNLHKLAPRKCTSFHTSFGRNLTRRPSHSIPNPSNLRCLSGARRPADFKERCLEIQTERGQEPLVRASEGSEGKSASEKVQISLDFTETYKRLPTYRRALDRVSNLHGYDHARDGKQRLR
jgi:hypothetical protein